MKKFMLVIPALVLATQTTQAQVTVGTPMPVCPPMVVGQTQQQIKAEKFILPSETKKILEDIRQRYDDRKLAEILGEPALRSIEGYSNLDNNQVNANIYAAAAAGGAAYAVVDYLWKRYAGDKNMQLDFDDRDFDVNPGIIQPWKPQVPYIGVKPFPVRAAVGEYPKYGKDIGPVAATPAAVGAAVVGAVAERVVGWGLRKAFGDANIQPQDIRVDAFDLPNNQISPGS